MAVAAGKIDHNNAIAPVTKAVAKLVPARVRNWPCGLRLVTSSPGAPSPRLPIELPKFDWTIGRPLSP